MRGLLRAIIARMVKYLQIDPYANAYTLDYRVWEQKFELDSLAYPTALAWSYWKTTGDTSIFTGDFSKMLDNVLATMQREQNHPRDSRYTHKELPEDGRGRAVSYTGMIWTGFRPVRRRVLLQLFDSVGDVRGRRAGRHVRDRAATSITTSSRRARRRPCATKCSAESKPTAWCSFRNTATSTPTRSTASATPSSPTTRTSPACWRRRTSATPRRATVTTKTRGASCSRKTIRRSIRATVARGIGSYHTPDHWVWPLALIMEGMTATSERREAGRAGAAPRERSRRSSAARVLQSRQSAAIHAPQLRLAERACSPSSS